MKKLQREFDSALIIITHDLGVVAEVADDILVMYAGRAVEHGPVADLFRRPEHPYTWGLLSSMPRLDRVREDRLRPIKGTPPSLINPPPGCRFHPRCPYAQRLGEICWTVEPELLEGPNDHSTRCHLGPVKAREVFVAEVEPLL
jgi:peptide/nickel transport system ATP-binding protein